MHELKRLMENIDNGDWDAVNRSSLLFVRSQDHLAIHDSDAPGWVITAFEVAMHYSDKLREIFDYGVASLPCDRSEPARSIVEARESFGLTVEDVARFAGVRKEDVVDAEDASTRTPISVLQNIAHVLDLDDAKLSVLHERTDREFGYRLRTFRRDGIVSKQDVMAFAEAAWVAQTQLRLESWLSISAQYSAELFEKNDNYGRAGYPAWKVGYDLAEEARKQLGAGQKAVSLREVCEKLGIPVIQTELSAEIAGATISARGVRAIVVGNDSRNNDVFIRRMTIAHELGHLLWDSHESLKDVCVDKFVDMHADPESDYHSKYVEQRANAFAVHFIAPISQSSDLNVGGCDHKELIVSTVERFGLTVTSAVYHLNNRLKCGISNVHILEEELDRGSWEGLESCGVDMFPIRSVPISRRGIFSYRVVQCYIDKLISDVTAASYLRCGVEDFCAHFETINSMF